MNVLGDTIYVSYLSTLLHLTGNDREKKMLAPTHKFPVQVTL